MYAPDQLRTWAIDLRACAARCVDPQHMKECLLLAERYEDLANSTEQFMVALAKAGTAPPWGYRN
jgi:hypothetical protein